MAEFTDTYMLNLARHPDVPRYAVAHSFGTYVVGQSLANHPKMSFDRAYFTGSVLPRTFNWYGLDGHRQIIPQQLNSLRNDCAVNDWPVGFLCSALNKLGEGRLGTGGFRGFARTETGSMVQFKDYFPGGHSAPLNDHDNRDTICKFLLTGAEVGMAKKQAQPVSRSEKFLHATSENAATISILALVLLFAGAPALIAYLSGSVFAAALVFFLLAGAIIWVLNAI
jgi:hypothetical protein